MKPAMLLLILLPAIAFMACSKSKKDNTIVEINKQSGTASVPLSGCKTWAFTNDDVKICYDSLIHESRCPIQYTCVWGGMAIGKFSFHVNNQKHTLTLTVGGKDTTIGNYKIGLEMIDPYPGVTPRPQPSATIKISR
jgi:hypothetical protein